MNISKIAIQRPILIIVIFAVLGVLGIFGYTQLNYELMPKMSSPVVSVNTIYPGASPSEVENSVTKAVEDALSSLEGADKITSTSMEGISMVIIQLDYSTDVDMALQDAQRKINAIVGFLPDDVQAPSLGKFDFSEMPIMRLGVSGQVSGIELYDLVKNKVEPKLAKIPGVARVSIMGGQEREIRVNISEEKLEAQGLSILQVSQAISNANLDFPTGKVKDEGGQTLIRLSGKYTSLEQMKDLVVAQKMDGSSVQLRDIADVHDTQKDPDMISRVDGVNSIGLSIQKQGDANTVEVSQQAKEIMSQLEEEYAAAGLSFAIASDTSDFTLEAANAVTFDLMLAIFIVAIVMLFFLHSIRNAIIVMISVPASIVATFIAMWILGYSLNLMTLLALSLVVGILVDDAIVVIENIYRHLEKGKSRAQAAYDGIREIGITVVSITLVIVTVFVPLSMSSGPISDFLRQFSLVIAISTMLSLFVAFTLIPLLASRFSKLEVLNKRNPISRVFIWFESFIDAFQSGVTSILRWAFGHKVITLGITLLLLVGSVSLVAFGFIGSEFVSQGDRGEFLVQVELPKDATIEQTNFKAREVERFLESKPEVAQISSTVGSSSNMMTGSAAPYMAEVNVTMVDKKERSVTADVFARQMKVALEENITGAKITALPVSIMGTADQAPIQVIITGTELDELIVFSESVMGAITDVKGAAEVQTSVDAGNPEISVTVDRDKMAALGLSMEMVGATMQNAFSGSQTSKFRDGEYDYDINVQLDQFDRKNAEDIRSLSLLNNKGEVVKLGQFATVNETTGPAKLERLDRIASVTVNAQVLGRPVGTVGAEVQKALADMDVPEGVSLKMGGQFEQQGDAFGSLGLALIASLFFVYLIMVALYNNFVYPLVVMFSVPLAVIGAFLALALVQDSLSIFSMLGMIMLIGLVTKNAILVVDFTNQLKKAGLKVKDALVKATQSRFRPILMTTLAMVFGMMPIALATGAGAEWKNGLAWVLIGGLTSSMFLTLIVVPVMYYIFDRLLEKLGMNKGSVIQIDDRPLDGVDSEIEEMLHEKGAAA